MIIYPPAKLRHRLGALLYDSLFIGALFMAISVIWVLVTGDEITSSSKYYRFYQVSLIITAYAYYLFFWFRDAHSTGMRAWRLRIQQFNGKPITSKQAIIRLLAAPFSFLFLGLGFLWILISPTKRAWHDTISKTEIIQLPKKKK